MYNWMLSSFCSTCMHTHKEQNGQQGVIFLCSLHTHTHTQRRKPFYLYSVDNTEILLFLTKDFFHCKQMHFRSRGSEYWHKLGTVHFLTFTQYATSTHQWDMFSVYNTDMTHAHKLELPSSFPIVYNLCVTHPIKWPHPWTRSNITKWVTAASQKPTPFLQTCPSSILLINEHEIGLGQTKPDHYYVYFHISF